MLEAATPDVDIEHLTLEYQHHRLFNDFHLHLPACTWTAILGPSGVGKSTLLRLLASLPTGVDVAPRQDVIQASDHKPLPGRVAYMSQRESLMPWLTVLDNCLLGHRLRGKKITVTEREAALALLERVGLAHAIHLRPQQLSGGMRQRVALVRTLLEKRLLVLMDEPFSAVDVVTRLALQDLAVELLGEKTVLLVTHDPLEALRVADRVYVLCGEPAQLSEVIIPKGTRPRSSADPAILQQQASLLRVLIGGTKIEGGQA